MLMTKTSGRDKRNDHLNVMVNTHIAVAIKRLKNIHFKLLKLLNYEFLFFEFRNCLKYDNIECVAYLAAACREIHVDIM